MKIGILGGTFNPPHLGHLIIANEVKEKLSLAKVFFIPTNIPPHKQAYKISVKHRLKMIKLAVSGNKSFKVLDIEIKRLGVSYTIDTIEELKRKYPKDDFYLIVGSDLANEFNTWKDFPKLKKQISIVVAWRKLYPVKYKDGFKVVKVTNLDLSSSQIRELIKKRLSVKYLIPDKVREYINKYKLYN